MSDDPPDEDLLARVDLLPPISLSGAFFRHTARNRDPLSGAGARLSGGRWNPRGLFPALYLATPVDACMRELDRMAGNQGVTVEDLLLAGRERYSQPGVSHPARVAFGPANHLVGLLLSCARHARRSDATRRL